MQIREKMQANLGMPDKGSDYTYTYDITEEILSFRQIIRHRYCLQQSTITTLSRNLQTQSSCNSPHKHNTTNITLQSHHYSETIIQVKEGTEYPFGHHERTE